MCEHQLSEPVLGIAWDGTGYGDDGTIWGGEFLLCDQNGYERVAYFEPFYFWVVMLVLKRSSAFWLHFLWDVLGDEADIHLLNYFDEKSLKLLKNVYTKKINAPLCSSVRLFSTVAVLCGMEENVTYDGESGLLIEALYDPVITEYYDVEIDDKIIDYKSMFSRCSMTKTPMLSPLNSLILWLKS